MMIQDKLHLDAHVAVFSKLGWRACCSMTILHTLKTTLIMRKISKEMKRLVSEAHDSDESRERDYFSERNLEIGISVTFLIVIGAFLTQQQIFTVSIGFLTFLFAIILALFGYWLLLNETLEEYLKALLARLQRKQIARVLVVPVLTILILIVTQLSGFTTNEFENNLALNILIYLVYASVPIFLAEGIVIKRSSLNHLLTFALGMFIIFWGWWFIEFNWLAPLVSGVPMEEFIGLIALGWSFLIILSHEIPRNVSRYLQLNSFRVVGIWLLILIVAIVPAALQSEFIRVGLNDVFNQGVLAIVLAILIFLGIFFFTGFVEEVLFRGLIFQWTTNYLTSGKLSQSLKKAALLALFGFVSLLIFITPHVGLADPIVSGPYTSLPLPVVYTTISIIYFLIGVLLVYSTDNTELIILVWSSMIFGWAHFEDWRYLIFATIAGIGYCDTYRRTKNVLPAATLHATVDFIWSMIFAG